MQRSQPPELATQAMNFDEAPRIDSQFARPPKIFSIRVRNAQSTMELAVRELYGNYVAPLRGLVIAASFLSSHRLAAERDLVSP